VVVCTPLTVQQPGPEVPGRHCVPPLLVDEVALVLVVEGCAPHWVHDPPHAVLAAPGSA
jgi:hypothetical protein